MPRSFALSAAAFLFRRAAHTCHRWNIKCGGARENIVARNLDKLIHYTTASAADVVVARRRNDKNISATQQADDDNDDPSEDMNAMRIYVNVVYWNRKFRVGYSR